MHLCAAGQDSVCPTWPDCFVRGVKSSWLAAIRHSDDGNYIAEVPQTSVNPCLYRSGGSGSDAVLASVSQSLLPNGQTVLIILSLDKTGLSRQD